MYNLINVTDMCIKFSLKFIAAKYDTTLDTT
jgi:hypothetical protein